MRIPVGPGVFSEQWSGDMVIEALLRGSYQFLESVSNPLALNSGPIFQELDQESPAITIEERVHQWEEITGKHFMYSEVFGQRNIPGLFLAYRIFPERCDGDLLVAVYVRELNDYIGFNFVSDAREAVAESTVSEYALSLFQNYRTQIRRQSGVF